MNIQEYINKLEINEINEEKCKKMLKRFGEKQINEYINNAITNEKIEDFEKINKIMNIIDFITNNNINNSSVSDIVSAYLKTIGNIRVLTREEEQKYGKIIAESKEVFNISDKDPNNIFITKTINKNKEKILNIEKIFASISNEEDKKEIFSILNNYFFFEDIWNEATSDRIIKYYLNEYQKLTKELNKIPNTNELNNYFQNNNLYNIFTNFSNNNKYENIDLLKKYLKQYVLFMHARNMMVIHNQKLVFSIAKRIKNNNLMDTVNNGNLGLMKAIEMFDYKRNNKFSTYAIWWIKQSIYREISNTEHLIRVPVHFQEQYDKVNRFKKEFITKNKREPSIEEISNGLSITIEKTKQVLEYEKNTLKPASLNTKIGDDKETELIDFVVNNDARPEKTAEENELKEKVEELLDCLTEREKKIICQRFGLFGQKAQTLEQVAGSFEKKITRERVRQIESNAMKKLRQRSKKNELEAFIN